MTCSATAKTASWRRLTTVGELALRVRPVFEARRDWVVAVREGLEVLLGVLDGEPALRWLLFVEALAVGPRVLARRAEILGELAAVVDRGRAGAKDAAELPALTAEGVVGAAFSVIHARLSEQHPEPLADLQGSLMAMIVLPAEPLSPWWGASSGSRPTDLISGQAGRIVVTAENRGDASSDGEVTIVDRLPVGLEATGVEDRVGFCS